MRLAYLGLLSSIFNWVFQNILNPIIRVIANLLSGVFEIIFNNILMPILVAVFESFAPWVLKELKTLFASMLYKAMAILCRMLDYFQEMFDIFTGAKPIEYDGKTTSLLEALAYTKEIRAMFYVILLAGLALSLLFAIIAVGKSTLDIDMETKRPVGAVLRTTVKSFITMLILPVSLIFMLALAGVVMNTISEATSIAMENNTTIGRIIFCTSTLNAAKNSSYNVENMTEEQKEGVNFLTIYPREAYYSTSIEDTKNYWDSETVENDFVFADMDFVTAAVMIYFLGITMCSTVLSAVQRIFDVLVLACLAPLFVSTMPIDEGEKYKKWKDFFIGKLFSAYGSVLSMDIFMMLVPFIMGSTISFGSSSTQRDYIIRLVFICGGAYAVPRFGPMITTMLNWQAGQAESSNARMVSSYADKYIGGKVRGLALSAVGGAFSKVASAVSLNPNSTKLADAKWKAMQENFDKHGLEARADASEDKKDEDGKADLKDKKDGVDTKGKKDGADSKDKKGGEEDGKKSELESSANLSKFGGSGTAGEPGRFNRALKWIQNTFPCKADKNGNYKFNFGLVSATYNAKGECTGFKVPFFSFGFDKNHGCRMTGWNIPGVCKAERHGENSTFQLTSIPMLGIKRQEGQDGQMHVTSALGIMERKPAQDGTYHTTSFLGVQRNIEFNSNTGHYESSGVRIGNLTFGGGDYSEQLMKDQREADKKK